MTLFEENWTPFCTVLVTVLPSKTLRYLEQVNELPYDVTVSETKN